MNCTYKKYSSNTVCKECSDIYKKNLRVIKNEFRLVIRELNRNRTINKCTSTINGLHIKDCLIYLYEVNTERNIQKTIEDLRVLQRNVEKRCLENYQHITKIVEICSRDKHIQTYIKSLKQTDWQKKSSLILK